MTQQMNLWRIDCQQTLSPHKVTSYFVMAPDIPNAILAADTWLRGNDILQVVFISPHGLHPNA